MSIPSSIAVQDLPRYFDVDRSITNLENGGWNVMPRETLAAYIEKIGQVNRLNAYYARNLVPNHPLYQQLGESRRSVAELLGVQTDEIAFTRSGTEALQNLIVNYQGLKPGDAVIHCDLDYTHMIAAMDYLGTHRGVEVVSFQLPEPATTANILESYRDVLERTPRAKLLLLTYVSNKTGLVLPVKQIVEMARERGVDTILDAAHAVGCLAFTLPETGADFVGWSMHKWLAAPMGLGAMYVRKVRQSSIGVSYNSPDYPEDDLRSRVPSGTGNFAAELTISAAVAFHRAIGPAAKEQHLRSLRNSWVDRARDIPGVQITVPDDPERYCAITSFRLAGMHTTADAECVQRRLLEEHRILTVARSGPAAGPVVRVTPGLYTSSSDLDALVTALEAEHSMLA